MKIVALLTSGFISLTLFLSAIDIEKKRASLEKTSGSNESSKDYHELNNLLQEKKCQLKEYYESIQQEYLALASESLNDDDVKSLFQNKKETIDSMRKEIAEVEKEWNIRARKELSQDAEGLWHQPDTTIGQLVVDYGANDYVWLMPQEIANVKVHVSSHLSVPKSMWTEMLQLVLAHNGIGIKPLNSFARQLYFLKQNLSQVASITDSRDELTLMSPDSRVSFVVEAPPSELRRIYIFLEKFVPQEQMQMQAVNNNIVFTGFVREIHEILKVYDFVQQPKQKQEYRLIALQKGQSDEVGKILLSIFEGDGIKNIGDQMPTQGHHGHSMVQQKQSSTSGEQATGFRAVSLKHPAQSLFLMGKPEQLDKAEQIIADIEEKIGQVQDKAVYWYSCKHSEAEELADVLSQVYSKMIASPDAFSLGADAKSRWPMDPRDRFNNQSKPDNRFAINPTKNGEGSQKRYEKNENFIVDQKTNSIVVVVESFVLPKLKELLKKLDVPKKMVQIDVLLFEKRVSDNNTFGLNLLRMGDAATNKHKRSLTWNTSSKSSSKKKHEEADGAKGLLSFLISRTKHGAIPAYDLAYNFLLTQNDIQVNANPSITCVNQTPASISVTEEISINTGVVEIDTTKATRLKDSFSRENYGIKIQLTPTIHAKASDEDGTTGPRYVHLSTDIAFETTVPKKNDRPDVIKRNIKNEVRIPDGETVILGGLRRKIASDDQEMIPFLGELPGIGKLFSQTVMQDSTTEMFIFLTPRIIPDELDEYRLMRQKEVMTRPGDIPEFLQELADAQDGEKRSMFEHSMKMLLGRGDKSPVVSQRSR